MINREQMNIVVVGHVDHGKSTVIGRLLADTGSLPLGKLQQVKDQCEKNSRPFEYAFLLDALKDEQSQGITIDTARCFFKTSKRDYIIIDAPGHVEFLKNMVSGAARAEAALLVIDAHEGIAENSKRHGYLMSMLGIRQLIVLVNKMDLIGHDRIVYEKLIKEYGEFLTKLGLEPNAFVPISARNGDNLATVSEFMPWYKGRTVLDLVDALDKQKDDLQKPFRFPVQDIYKFTEAGDDRRIIAGTVESGSVSVGDEVVFLPSGKRSTILTIEGFNEAPRTTISSGRATGVTLSDELYLKRGEIMSKVKEELPRVADRFKANVFWMGNAPLVMGKKYRLKLATARIQVRLLEVVSCIDATELSSIAGKQQMDRHDVAECIFETVKPIAFDPVDKLETTARFVLVDNYDIVGGGIIIDADGEGKSWLTRHVRSREIAWDKGKINTSERISRNGHRGKAIVICGDGHQKEIARELEHKLFFAGYQSYYSSIENVRIGIDSDDDYKEEHGVNNLYHLGELSRVLTDAGLIFITVLDDADVSDIALLRKLNEPYQVLFVWAGKDDQALGAVDMKFGPDTSPDQCVLEITGFLRTEKIITDYSI